MVAATVLALVPLLILPGVSFYFDITPKIAVLALGTAILLAAGGARSVQTLRSAPEGRRLWWLVAAQSVWLAAATALSSDPRLSILGSNWRRFGLLSYLAVLWFTAMLAAELIRDPGRLRPLLRTTSAVSIPIALYGCAQYFGLDPFLPGGAYHVGEGIWSIVRPPATLGHAGYFANYLVSCVFLSTALRRIEKRGVWRWIGLAAILLGVAGVLLSGTRGAVLGLLAGGAYLALASKGRLDRRHAAAGAAALVLVTLFYYSPAGLKLRARMRWAVEDARGGARLWLWADSLRMAAARPVAGWGPETFSPRFPHFESKALAMAYPDYFHESPHNILLDSLTAQGVPGFVCLAAFVVLGFRAAVRSDKVPWRAPLGAGLLAALVAHQFEVFTLAPALYFFLTIAILAAGAPVSGTEDRKPLLSLRLAVLPACAALASYGLLVTAADGALLASSGALQSGRPGPAGSYEFYRRLGFRDDLWFARAAANLAARARDPLTAAEPMRLAAQAARLACVSSESPQNGCYELARIYALHNDAKRAEEALRAAIAASPNWFKPHWTLARLLAAAGRTAEARAEARLAIELDNGRHAEVRQTLSGLFPSP